MSSVFCHERDRATHLAPARPDTHCPPPSTKVSARALLPGASVAQARLAPAVVDDRHGEEADQIEAIQLTRPK